MTHGNPAKASRREAMAGAAALGLAAALPARAGMDATVHEVEIRSFRFNPETLEVKVGDRIRWINRDRTRHDATALDRRWNTEVIGRDQSAELTATAEMSGEYMCSIHPRMRAMLNVVAA